MNLPKTRPLAMAWFILVSAIVSFIASFGLAREGYLLAAEGREPSCDINPFFSCGDVMQSWQARVFLEAPNQLMGIAGFAVVITVAVALLTGARFPRWFWGFLTLGIFGAWAFLMWLFYQAVFNIGFLCIYCMIVWVSHSVLLWVYLPWAAGNGLLGGPQWFKRLGKTLMPYSWVAIVANFATIALSIYVQFPLLFS